MGAYDPNILTILGISRKEDVISNLLRYCIEAAPSFRNTFLRSICGIDPPTVCSIRVLTRIATATAGTPDLVIAIEEPAGHRLIILENKLLADEGDDQTLPYSSPECVSSLKARLGWRDIPIAGSFIYLTLFPDQEPTSAVFRKATYLDLLEATRNLKALEDSLAQLLLDALNSQLRDFYSHGCIAPEQVLLEKLQETDPLEGNYLYFKAFVQGLSLNEGLRVETTFRSSALGRRYFGAVISKPSWHPFEMQKVDGTYQLDAKKHFNIHFEPQFHHLKGALELYLHYEVNPYATADWVAQNVAPTQVKAYAKVRELFVESLRSKTLPTVIFGGGSNQIAKARLNLMSVTVKEAQTSIADMINEVTLHIDEIIDDPMGIFIS